MAATTEAPAAIRPFTIEISDAAERPAAVLTEIDGLDIHFIHVKSRHENALPAILIHMDFRPTTRPRRVRIPPISLFVGGCSANAAGFRAPICGADGTPVQIVGAVLRPGLEAGAGDRP
jgi:Epoxide hydrolase N terminus